MRAAAPLSAARCISTRRYLGANYLSRLAREEVLAIAEQTGETAQFCVLHGNKYTLVHMQKGTRILRISTDLGVTVPIPWTASGRLLLDHMSREEVEHFRVSIPLLHGGNKSTRQPFMANCAAPVAMIIALPLIWSG
jgi:DNA-binding IclR family transcriptional regulator